MLLGAYLFYYYYIEIDTENVVDLVDLVLTKLHSVIDETLFDAWSFHSDTNSLNELRDAWDRVWSCLVCGVHNEELT